MTGLDMKSKCNKKWLLRSVDYITTFLYYITGVDSFYSPGELIFSGHVSSHSFLTLMWGGGLNWADLLPH